MASVAYIGPLVTLWRGGGGGGLARGPPDVQNTQLCFVLGFFRMQSVLLTEGSIVDTCYGMWESLH
jgi:hypothetical protein